MKPDIHVGDMVKQLRDKYFHKKRKLKVGIVTNVVQFNPANPIGQHGTVEILMMTVS